jgi:hypothetical protein
VSSEEHAESDVIPMTMVAARKLENIFEKKAVKESFILSFLSESPNGCHQRDEVILFGIDPVDAGERPD